VTCGCAGAGRAGRVGAVAPARLRGGPRRACTTAFAWRAHVLVGGLRNAWAHLPITASRGSKPTIQPPKPRALRAPQHAPAAAGLPATAAPAEVARGPRRPAAGCPAAQSTPEKGGGVGRGRQLGNGQSPGCGPALGGRSHLKRQLPRKVADATRRPAHLQPRARGGLRPRPILNRHSGPGGEGHVARRLGLDPLLLLPAQLAGRGAFSGVRRSVCLLRDWVGGAPARHDAMPRAAVRFAPPALPAPAAHPKTFKPQTPKTPGEIHLAPEDRPPVQLCQLRARPHSRRVRRQPPRQRLQQRGLGEVWQAAPARGRRLGRAKPGRAVAPRLGGGGNGEGAPAVTLERLGRGEGRASTWVPSSQRGAQWAAFSTPQGWVGTHNEGAPRARPARAIHPGSHVARAASKGAPLRQSAPDFEPATL
jgi:hypothetical protein